MNNLLRGSTERDRILRTLQGLTRGRRGSATFSSTILEQLKNARRPLLFSVLPRMLRDTGRTPEALQTGFHYIDATGQVRGGSVVSPRMWQRALATSRAISRRRREKTPAKSLERKR